MTSTLPPRIPPRTPPRTAPRAAPTVVEHADDRRSWWTGVRERTPRHAVRGALAGVESAIGSWLVIAAVAVAGYVATAAEPELGSAGWVDAARAGSAIWLLAHGGGLQLGDATVTLVPLGVTLLALAAVAGSVRRARVEIWWAALGCVLVYAALAGLFTVFAGTPGSWRGIVGALVVAALGSWVGLRHRRPPLPAAVAGAVERLPAAVRAGIGAGARAVLVVLVSGLALVVLALVLGFSRVLDLHRALVPDAASTVILVVAQLLLLPTLVVWGSAFVVGPGFSVGTATSFSPSGIEAGPLPVVPVLGALPEPGSTPGWLVLLVLVGVGGGVVAGVRVRAAGSGFVGSAGGALVAAVSAAALLGALAWLSGGAIGPGAMADVGPDALAVGLAALWQVGLGAIAGALLLHPGTGAGLAIARAAVVGWWRQVQGPRG